MDRKRWRVGRKVPINIYEGDNPGRPICQCHSEDDAQRIVDAVNATLPSHRWVAAICTRCGITWSAHITSDICPGKPNA